ncbi:MAG TPA: sensor domain-containing diguanylate cyclase [Burkholderiales bacterium]|nr:sensor domain-containing diguanylate cyclase [Burkholderiales bacterium]
MSWRERDLSKIIEQIPIGVAVTLPDGTIEYANPHLCRLLGARRGELAGTPLSRYARGQQAPTPAPGGCREIQVSGGSGALDILESVYPLHDARGTVTHFIHLWQDISAQKQLDSLSALAFYDSLTGLPNRNLLRDRLERALAAARRNRGAFAVLYLDIDHFKSVNDTLGHEAGDELLRQFAARLAQSLRASDSVARWGGDEFVALLEGLGDPRLAARIARKLLKRCGGPYAVGGESRRITLSIGVSFYPRDARDIATLLDRADRALYVVKSRGRNGFHMLEEPACDYLLTA